MLGAMVVLVPYLSKKARKRVFLGAYELLSPYFTPLDRPRHIAHADVEVMR
jgi:ribosomal RNA-processing protein 12